MLHEAAGQWWWHDLKTMICLRGNKWHNILGAFVLYFLFAGFFSNVFQMMISVCLYCFLGSKLCVFLLCKLFCQLPSKKFMSRSDKKGFLFVFCSIESGRWCQHFCFGFLFCFYLFWLFGSKLILLDWRLQDYYGNFGKVSSRQGLQSYHKSFFEWIIWWWS